ncbi:MAG: 3-dehydroquinate synthase [Rhodospirillaceae bacterium]|nr:3-dehydroquinate synthase [Rhodospirillaceae bacterium]
MSASSVTKNIEKLNVALGERSYDILVGPGLIADAGPHIANVLGEQPRVVVVTDENVAPHYLGPLMASLKNANVEATAITLPAGEESKSFAMLEELTESLLELKIERTTTLIALGGGVIGDLVGFAAAITLRGIPFIQIPTTLLSQVDSSVGGKTGINSRLGKNLVGAFCQPLLVLGDIETLNTLSRREILAGYAEVVKYGLIANAGFFDWLVENGNAIIDGDVDARIHAIVTSCKAKADIVAKDELEMGVRALLNLGHTFGHALEAETGYSDKLLHGESVAIGSVMAFDVSQRTGLCGVEDFEKVRDYFKSIGLPVGITHIKGPDWTSSRLLEHMSRDKKVKDGKITFVLAHGIGDAFITSDVSSDTVAGMLEDYIAN